MLPRCLYLLSGLCLLAAPALANDSTAELKTGGLVLLKSSKIEMQSEDLFISSKEIRAQYVFINTSPTDLATVVAFPMPGIAMSGRGEDIVIPNENSNNFLDFSTSVNGRPVSARAELRAYQDDREVTSRLAAAGVGLTPNRQKTEIALDRLPASRKSELRMENLVTGDSGEMIPNWSLATTYHFKVVFPAGKATSIEHRYRPSVGESNVTSLGDATLRSESWIKEKMAKYCIDDATMEAIKNAKKPFPMEYGSPFTEERLSYVLHTGANWAGPIGKFHLVIDKGAPDNLISWCGFGAEGNAPSPVEIRKTDFTPTQDIDILIFKPFEKTLAHP